MLLDIILIGIGFLFLWKGSEHFVKAAAEIARRIGVSDLVIGLTLVSASTTLPEFTASVMASHLGSGGIAVGNAVGSDVTNIALILGTCMVIEGYSLEPLVLKRYGITLLLVCIFFVFLVPGGISRIEGCVLLFLFFLYLWSLSRERYTKRQIIEVSRGLKEIEPEPAWKLALKFGGGAVAIFVGARVLVNAALGIAVTLNVFESAIGSTIVALGTSLPEFSVSLRALKENIEQISVGNILGANTFNILWVTGVSALVNPLQLDANLKYFNVPMMIGVTALLLVFMRMGYQLKRWQGILFLMIYAFFVAYNYLQ